MPATNSPVNYKYCNIDENLIMTTDESVLKEPPGLLLGLGEFISKERNPGSFFNEGCEYESHLDTIDSTLFTLFLNPFEAYSQVY